MNLTLGNIIRNSSRDYKQNTKERVLFVYKEISERFWFTMLMFLPGMIKTLKRKDRNGVACLFHKRNRK